MDYKFVELYTDGAYSSRKKIGGWSCLLVYGNDTLVIYDKELNTTNNRMELLAVVNGLRMLKEPCFVHIVTDSKYVQNGIQYWVDNWVQNNWKTTTGEPVQHIDLWQEIYNFKQYHKITVQWVKSHTGKQDKKIYIGNDIVDHFAQLAYKK